LRLRTKIAGLQFGGSTARAIARVAHIKAKSVFNVEAWNKVRKIGDGTHRRGVVNVLEFESGRRETGCSNRIVRSSQLAGQRPNEKTCESPN
jgi:hypothetical protein